MCFGTEGAAVCTASCASHVIGGPDMLQALIELKLNYS